MHIIFLRELLIQDTLQKLALLFYETVKHL